MHKLCEDCKWQHYPLCYGIKMENGKYMDITTLKEHFRCGQKFRDTVDDATDLPKSDVEKKLEELENRISALENKAP